MVFESQIVKFKFGHLNCGVTLDSDTFISEIIDFCLVRYIHIRKCTDHCTFICANSIIGKFHKVKS